MNGPFVVVTTVNPLTGSAIVWSAPSGETFCNEATVKSAGLSYARP